MPFTDLPWPAGLEIQPIVKRVYGTPFGPDNPGRPKGAVDRVTRDLKRGITEAATNIGRDGHGEGGLVGYLEDLALNHKKCFTSLLVKVLPLQVSAGTLAGSIGTVNVISVPTEHYLSEADIARLKAPGHALSDPSSEIFTCAQDFEAPAAIAQEIEPQTPEEVQLLAELKSSTYEELLERAGVTNDVEHR